MDDFSKKGPKEPNFIALKEHVLGSLQRRNLAHSSRRERTRNYSDIVNKSKVTGLKPRRGSKKEASTQ